MQAEVSCATSRGEAPAEALPGLSNHLVVEHILSPVNKYFGDDPVDLARLCTVSPAMRDAVTATGLKIEEIGDDSARKIGCLSALRRWQRRGQLSNANEKYMCEAAALSGQLEERKLLRENSWPWDEETCEWAESGRHNEIL